MILNTKVDILSIVFIQNIICYWVVGLLAWFIYPDVWFHRLIHTVPLFVLLDVPFYTEMSVCHKPTEIFRFKIQWYFICETNNKELDRLVSLEIFLAS